VEGEPGTSRLAIIRAHLYVITCKGDAGADKAKGNNTINMQKHYNYNHKLF